MQLDHTGSTERRESPNTAPVLDVRASTRIRAILMERLSEMRQAQGLTQVQAARGRDWTFSAIAIESTRARLDRRTHRQTREQTSHLPA